AHALLDTGQADRALAVGLRAVRLGQRQDADSVGLAEALVIQGRALLDLGRTAEAVPVLRRALALAADPQFPQTTRARAQFALASALRAQGADRAGARELALGAQAALASQPPSLLKSRVEQWLAQR